MKFFKNLYFITPFLLSVFTLFFSSCEQADLRDPLESDSEAPGIVTDIEVENLPGGATISYTLPDDKDILYVVADYEIRKGVAYDVKSSYYNNSVTILGFGTTEEYDVDLYVVDRSGNKSERTTIKVNPLTPPVQLAFEKLDYTRGFGGIHLTFENETKANLVTNILVRNEANEWIEYDKYYTSLPNGDYSVRNLQSVPTTFGVYLYDRWNNHSDTLIREITPLFEMELDKSKFKELSLAGDAANAWNLPGLWNGVPQSGHGISSTGPFPKHFQFSLGTKSKLSRLKIWGVYDGREYSSGNIKEFEVWGSNNPDPNGSFEGWELMGTYTVVKPSGLPEGELSSDDRAVAAAGFDFDISPDAPAVLYVRLNILSSFASPRNSANGTAWSREITLWGQEQP